MAEAAKEESKVGEPVAEEQPSTEKAAPERRQLLTDDELLVKHYPRYFYDKKEKFFPVDLNA